MPALWLAQGGRLLRQRARPPGDTGRESRGALADVPGAARRSASPVGSGGRALAPGESRSPSAGRVGGRRADGGLATPHRPPGRRLRPAPGHGAGGRSHGRATRPHVRGPRRAARARLLATAPRGLLRHRVRFGNGLRSRRRRSLSRAPARTRSRRGPGHRTVPRRPPDRYQHRHPELRRGSGSRLRPIHRRPQHGGDRRAGPVGDVGGLPRGPADRRRGGRTPARRDRRSRTAAAGGTAPFVTPGASSAPKRASASRTRSSRRAATRSPPASTSIPDCAVTGAREGFDVLVDGRRLATVRPSFPCVLTTTPLPRALRPRGRAPVPRPARALHGPLDRRLRPPFGRRCRTGSVDGTTRGPGARSAVVARPRNGPGRSSRGVSRRRVFA